VTVLDEFTKRETSDYRRDFHLFDLSLAFHFPHRAVTTELKVIIIIIIIIIIKVV
jgi:hypothetical protein